MNFYPERLLELLPYMGKGRRPPARAGLSYL